MPDTPVTPTPVDDRLTSTNRIVYENTSESTMPFFQAVEPTLHHHDEDRPPFGPADDLGFDRPLFDAAAVDPATQEAELPEYRMLVAATRAPPPSIGPELIVDDDEPTQQMELEEELIPTPPWPVDALPQETLFESPAPGTDTCLNPHLPPVYGFTTSPRLTAAVRRRHRWPWLAAGLVTAVAALFAAWLLIQTREPIRSEPSAPAPRRTLVVTQKAPNRPVLEPAAPNQEVDASSRSDLREPPDPADELEALIENRRWIQAAQALRKLPRSRRTSEVRLQLWNAEILHRTGHLEPARRAYAALVARGHGLGRRQRIEALIGLSEVLLKRNYRTASRSNARRALRLLGGDTLGGLRRRAQLQLQRCEVALKR